MSTVHVSKHEEYGMEVDGSSANTPLVVLRAPKPRYAVSLTAEMRDAAQKRMESPFHADGMEKVDKSTTRSAFIAFGAQDHGVPVQKEVQGTGENLHGALDKLFQACETQSKQLSQGKPARKPAFEKYLHCKTNTALGKKRSRGGGACMDNQSELYLRLIQFTAVSSSLFAIRSIIMHCSRY